MTLIDRIAAAQPEDQREPDNLDAIIARMSEAQRARLCSLDPDDVCRFGYAPFKGQSMGLFQVAPGWERMELSAKGHAVRARLKEMNDGN